MELETIVGNLKDYNKLEEGSFQCVDSLMDERSVNPKLRNDYFYTGDGQGYFLRKDGSVDWAITRESNNLLLRYIDDETDSSFVQLVNSGDYVPDIGEAVTAKNAKDTVVVDMGKLRLSRENDEFCYLQIRTSDGFILNGDSYERPNVEERKVMKRLGYTPLNLKFMEKSEQNIESTRIYVVNPDYVKRHGSENISLWRASWLRDFGNCSIFDASGRSIDVGSCLRGVPDNSPKANAKNLGVVADDYLTAYQTLINNPCRMTDDVAARLTAAVANYLQTKIK